MSRFRVEDCEMVYENYPYQAFAYPDESPENPFDSWDMLGRFAFKRSCHFIVSKNIDELPNDLTTYQIICEGTDDEEEIEVDIGMTEYMEKNFNSVITLPIAYFDEMRECSDERANGCVYISADRFKKEYGELTPENIEKAESVLRSEIELHNYWGNGDVWGWIVFDMTDVEDCGDLDVGGHIYGVWGYYGSDHKESGLLDSAIEHIDYLVRQDVKKLLDTQKRYIDEGDRVTIQMDVDVEYCNGDKFQWDDNPSGRASKPIPIKFIDAQGNDYPIKKDEKGYYFEYKGDLPSL